MSLAGRNQDVGGRKMSQILTNTENEYRKTCDLFDKISQEIYYGMNFRFNLNQLRENDLDMFLKLDAMMNRCKISRTENKI
jgi:hypothetical protein